MKYTIIELQLQLLPLQFNGKPKGTHSRDVLVRQVLESSCKHLPCDDELASLSDCEGENSGDERIVVKYSEVGEGRRRGGGAAELRVDHLSHHFSQIPSAENCRVQKREEARTQEDDA